MGQPVAVEQSAGGSPAIVRFETNRSLTGMGHERFTSADQAKGPRPAAVLARRFFESGQVAGVHVCTATSSLQRWLLVPRSLVSMKLFAICISTGSQEWCNQLWKNC